MRSFTAVLSGDAVWVSTLDTEMKVERIPLKIDGRERMQLEVDYRLAWDSGGTFLKVTGSRVKVFSAHRSDPLWRVDYLQAATAKPVAYLHVHAHRDEIVHLMAAGAKSPVRDRDREEFRYGLADLHFPLGGDRFRPCLEDVLQMLIREFGMDCAPQAMDAIDAGRQRWRDRQLMAAVRDHPEAAATALRSLGYRVEHDDPPPPRLEYLRRY